MSFFPELYCHSKNTIKVELDLSNYLEKFGLQTSIHQNLLNKLI